jgi:hypothetical protein
MLCCWAQAEPPLLSESGLLALELLYHSLEVFVGFLEGGARTILVDVLLLLRCHIRDISEAAYTS